MRRSLRSAIVLGASCLVPVLAIRAQQPPATTPTAQPSAAGRRQGRDLEGGDRPRRSHQGRGIEEVAGHGDLELPDRRDRSAADRLAQHETRQRVDTRPDGGVGALRRPPRAVGPVRTRLDAQAVLRPGDRAAVHPDHRLSQGLVARHRGERGGAGRVLRREVRGRFRAVQGEDQGGDRPDRGRPARSWRTSSPWARARPTRSCSRWPTPPSPTPAAWVAAVAAVRASRVSKDRGRAAVRARRRPAAPRPPAMLLPAAVSP